MPSQRRIRSVINVSAKAFRINARNVPPPIEQRRRIERPSRRRSQLGDRPSHLRHCEPLTRLHPVHELVRILPKLPNRNLVHTPNILQARFPCLPLIERFCGPPEIRCLSSFALDPPHEPIRKLDRTVQFSCFHVDWHHLIRQCICPKQRLHSRVFFPLPLPPFS